MPQTDETHVIIKDCIVVYDGMNRPEDPNSNGNTKRSLKVVIHPNNPDIQVLQQLADNELMQSEFKGNLPRGGFMPINYVQPNEFEGMYTGYAVVNCSTFKMPDVYDENVQQLNDPMQYLPMTYSGQNVDVMLHCSAYNNVSKGVASRMDGYLINMSKNAQRQSFGGGGVDTAAGFGGQGNANNQQNNGGQNYQQNNGAPQNNQNNGGGYDQNNGGQNYQRNNGQNNAPQQNNYQQPNNAPQNNGGGYDQNNANNQQNNGQNTAPQNNGGAPNQAHNYMPNNGGNNNQ